MPISLPPFFRPRHPEPEFYRLTCLGCGFEQYCELAPGCTVITAPDAGADSYETVEVLPVRCPRCGAALQKYKQPVKILH